MEQALHPRRARLLDLRRLLPIFSLQATSKGGRKAADAQLNLPTAKTASLRAELRGQAADIPPPQTLARLGTLELEPSTVPP